MRKWLRVIELWSFWQLKSRLQRNTDLSWREAEHMCTWVYDIFEMYTSIHIYLNLKIHVWQSAAWILLPLQSFPHWDVLQFFCGLFYGLMVSIHKTSQRMQYWFKHIHDSGWVLPPKDVIHPSQIHMESCTQIWAPPGVRKRTESTVIVRMVNFVSQNLFSQPLFQTSLILYMILYMINS